MESASKRKVPPAASPESDGRASKRQRLPDDNLVETAESTTEMGLKFLETMKAAKDKTGRLIATGFLELPDKNEIPQYYEEIKLPVAFSTIEAKLHKGGYLTLAEVESDVKRMVNNAKQFNDKHSLIYADAERVRKTASNYMVKHNPAYRNPNYTAIATPIPGDEEKKPQVQKPQANGHPDTPTITREMSERPKRAAAVPQTPAAPTPTPSRTTRKGGRDSAPPDKGAEHDLSGLSFSEAQERLIQDFIDYIEPESGLQIYAPFVQLPSRTLKDYYATIKNPMSLQQVLKQTQGFLGRKEGYSGASNFKTWQQLEEWVSLIWNNARVFNEDGSDLFNLANEFEEHFKQRLEEAKAKVPEPSQPTIKLKMSAPKPTGTPSGIKLRLGGAKASPAPVSAPDTPAARSSSTPGVIVDNEALERQQKHVQAGMNGQRPPSAGVAARNPFSRAGSDAAPAPTSSQQENTRSGSAASPPAANGVKSETHAGQSPALDTIRLSSQAPEASKAAPPQSSMPPPATATPRVPSGSPYANGLPSHGTSTAHHGGSYHQPNGFDNKHRTHSIADALLPNIVIASHPGLNLPRPLKINIPASPTLTQQSVTISLPGTHGSIQIMPHVPVALSQRPWRLFVTVNNTRLAEAVQPVGLAEKREKGKPLFEARLQPGVNRVDVEVIAGTASAPVRGQAPVKQQQDEVQMEKCTIFVNLMRA